MKTFCEDPTEAGGVAQFVPGDYWRALALFVAAIALRVPFRSQFAYEWDSAQFALAVGEYNLRIGQPHAPGFYLYIALGRLMNLLVGEPHAALVWVSVIAGAWLAAAGYLLATSMFGRRCGVVTGLILLTNPLCWFHGDIALSTIVDGALVVSFVLACWRALQRGVTWVQVITLAVLWAAMAGVRQQTAPLLIPLWLYVLWRHARPRRWKLACGVLLAVGFSLLWLVPTMKSAGGLASYVELVRLKSHYDAPRTVWGGGGAGALLMDAICTGRACWAGLLVAGIFSLMEFFRWLVFERILSKEPTAETIHVPANRMRFCVLALWVMPMLVFDMVMYVAMPGHILNFFPAVAMLAGVGLVRFSERVVSLTDRGTWALGGVMTVVVVVNVVVFVFSPQGTAFLLAGLEVTGVDIHEHDVEMAKCLRTIRERWPSSKDVVICHRYEDFYWGFRQFEYHLPEYENLLLTTDASLPGDLGRKNWIGYERHTTFRGEEPMTGGRDFLLVVPPGQSVDIFKSEFETQGATLAMDSKVKLYVSHRRK